MKVTHTLLMSAACPVAPRLDFYECVVVTDRLIRTEDIAKAVDAYYGAKIFQEQICQELADKLQCQVTLRGEHSGVKTEVTCEPKAAVSDLQVKKEE